MIVTGNKVGFKILHSVVVIYLCKHFLSVLFGWKTEI